ncbi:MAG: hypothetical protein JWP08_3011 [Bryobacterales bacterium]|nr:hypothetical protein [Bryobacterales bacterium]
MRDVFDFTAPPGPLGWIAEHLFLTQYMRNSLQRRNAEMKIVAEYEQGGEFLSHAV